MSGGEYNEQNRWERGEQVPGGCGFAVLRGAHGMGHCDLRENKG